MSNKRKREQTVSDRAPGARGRWRDGGVWLTVCLDPSCPDFGIHQMAGAGGHDSGPRTARGQGWHPDPSARPFRDASTEVSDAQGT